MKGVSCTYIGCVFVVTYQGQKARTMDGGGHHRLVLIKWLLKEAVTLKCIDE